MTALNGIRINYIFQKITFTSLYKEAIGCCWDKINIYLSKFHSMEYVEG